MISRSQVASALAYFDSCDDSVLLHQLISEIAPRAKKMVGRMLAATQEEALPGPADIEAARKAASREDALATLRATDDFALLQALARSIGRRVEALEIAASADFPPGARVTVPERPTFPPGEPVCPGAVESTGTSLRVLLDDGRSWEGPPTLARLEVSP